MRRLFDDLVHEVSFGQRVNSMDVTDVVVVAVVLISVGMFFLRGSMLRLK